MFLDVRLVLLEVYGVYFLFVVSSYYLLTILGYMPLTDLESRCTYPK